MVSPVQDELHIRSQPRLARSLEPARYDDYTAALLTVAEGSRVRFRRDGDQNDDQRYDDDSSSSLSRDRPGGALIPYPTLQPSIEPRKARKIISGEVRFERTKVPSKFIGENVQSRRKKAPPVHKARAPPPSQHPPLSPKTSASSTTLDAKATSQGLTATLPAPRLNKSPARMPNRVPLRRKMSTPPHHPPPSPGQVPKPPFLLKARPKTPPHFRRQAQRKYLTDSNPESTDDDDDDSEWKRRSASSSSGSASRSSEPSERSWGPSRGRQPILMAYRDLRDAQFKINELYEQLVEEQTRKEAIKHDRNKLENELYKRLRQALVSRPEVKHLAPVFRNLQQVREQYGHSENRVNDLVQDMQQCHGEAQGIQAEFLSYFVKEVDSSGTSSPSTHSKALEDPPPYALAGISGERYSSNKDPLYFELEDAVAELHLAQEARDDFFRAKRYIDEEIRKLEAIRSSGEVPGPEPPAARSQGLGPGDLEFLRDSEETDKETREDVVRWKEKVDFLFDQCTKKGVMPQHAPFFDENGYNFHVEEMRLDTPSLQRQPVLNLNHPHFPGLISSPMHLMMGPFPKTAWQAYEEAGTSKNAIPQSVLLERRKELLIEHPFGVPNRKNGGNPSPEMSKTEFINRWLLHQLRTTPMLALICFNTFSLVVKIKSIRRWEPDVINFWAQDSAYAPIVTSSPSNSDGGFFVDTAPTVVLSRAATLTPDTTHKKPVAYGVEADSKSTA